MKILIEGEKYPLSTLEAIFDDTIFYTHRGNEGVITSVGYYHSFQKNQLVYILPKVFMLNTTKTVFEEITKDELLSFESLETFKHKNEYNWIRQLSVYFYNSLLEYRKRVTKSNLVTKNESFDLNTNIGDKEYSYLDLLLSFISFYKKNQITHLYKQIERKSKQSKKVKWEKTIRKNTPILTNDNKPIYTQFRNRKKVIHKEEELLTYFFSILNHFNNEHKLYLEVDKSYPILKGKKFKQFQKNGLTKLKKIKYRYFNDTLKRIYALCEFYLSQTDTSSPQKRNKEFIAVKNYNLVFEDMIDKLLTDETYKIQDRTQKIDKLRKNKDGKIIDHIYQDQSIIDTSNVFYIGDSKYYKSSNVAGQNSKQKQFTYARNIIQYNINLLNKGNSIENTRYRDSLTEGYNITPNFFIYGYIQNYHDFENDHLAEHERQDVAKIWHFEKRLFDRDTLFVHQYRINFLYVLRSYTQFSASKIQQFRTHTKAKFRTNFINFFNDSEKSLFRLYKYTNKDYEEFVETNFRKIHGKVFLSDSNELILAKHTSDECEILNALIESPNFISYTLE